MKRILLALFSILFLLGCTDNQPVSSSMIASKLTPDEKEKLSRMWQINEELYFGMSKEECIKSSNVFTDDGYFYYYRGLFKDTTISVRLDFKFDNVLRGLEITEYPRSYDKVTKGYSFSSFEDIESDDYRKNDEIFALATRIAGPHFFHKYIHDEVLKHLQRTTYNDLIYYRFYNLIDKYVKGEKYEVGLRVICKLEGNPIDYKAISYEFRSSHAIDLRKTEDK